MTESNDDKLKPRVEVNDKVTEARDEQPTAGTQMSLFYDNVAELPVFGKKTNIRSSSPFHESIQPYGRSPTVNKKKLQKVLDIADKLDSQMTEVFKMIQQLA